VVSIDGTSGFVSMNESAYDGISFSVLVKAVTPFGTPVTKPISITTNVPTNPCEGQTLTAPASGYTFNAIRNGADSGAGPSIIKSSTKPKDDFIYSNPASACTIQMKLYEAGTSSKITLENASLSTQPYSDRGPGNAIDGNLNNYIGTNQNTGEWIKMKTQGGQKLIEKVRVYTSPCPSCERIKNNKIHVNDQFCGDLPSSLAGETWYEVTCGSIL
jgi:hypothetical protein